MKLAANSTTTLRRNSFSIADGLKTRLIALNASDESRLNYSWRLWKNCSAICRENWIRPEELEQVVRFCLLHVDPSKNYSYLKNVHNELDICTLPSGDYQSCFVFKRYWSQFSASRL